MTKRYELKSRSMMVNGRMVYVIDVNDTVTGKRVKWFGRHQRAEAEALAAELNGK